MKTGFFHKLFTLFLACFMLLCSVGCDQTDRPFKNVVTLRVCNWEEYIDLGDWDDDELIEIDNPYDPELGGVFGENSMIDDFTEWFNSQDYGFDVEVEYSTFGTNEDLYNRLNLGDVYDLVCPSEYMIMKLLANDMLEPYSEDFKEKKEGNYYANYVSPFVDCSDDSIFYRYGWSDYAACYMIGTTGMVYNPDCVTKEDVSTWNIVRNQDYYKQVTVKDNVRDSYFITLAMQNREYLIENDLSSEELSAIINATDDATIAKAEEILKEIKENVYSFETDSGKADMVTGKVVANFQWSGDAVYIMDEAESDEDNPLELWYSVPEECSNIWFDGWVMLKDGIQNDANRKTAAEAFVNFLSRPDNAIRNTYYIGYTPSIVGDMMYDYVNWSYGAILDPNDADYEEIEALYEYDLSTFFGESRSVLVNMDSLTVTGNFTKTEYSAYGTTYQLYRGGDINDGRQLFAQYPSADVLSRSVVMMDFGDKLADINQMWINVRCLDLLDIDSNLVIIIGAAAGLAVLAFVIYKFRYTIFAPKAKKGYKKISSKSL